MLDIPKKTSKKLLRLLKPSSNPRAVIDTNIFISGLLNPKGTPAKVINAFDTGEFELLLSEEIFEEYKKVINRFTKISVDARKDMLDKIINSSIFMVQLPAINEIKEDPTDNKFIECAVGGDADFIVSGDKHLLILQEYNEILIRNAQDFMGDLSLIRKTKPYLS